jgi:hypothetical protein
MKTLEKYLERRSEIRELQSLDLFWEKIENIVVIPVRAESETLPHTLASLAHAIVSHSIETTAAIIVVNASVDTAAETKTDNARTLDYLTRQHASFPFPLAWIDATTPGRELPAGTGVGLARKTGVDSVLAELVAHTPGDRLPQRLHDLLVFHLDADCEVSKNYITATRAALTRSPQSSAVKHGGCQRQRTAGSSEGAAAAVIDVRHPFELLPQGIERAAVVEYECYLRLCVEGLCHAGSPYAFHTIGSSMVSTLSAYVKVGGMPAKRTAGEDFYFLQQLAKTSGVLSVTDTCVFPSCRPSGRVPFGTGPYIAAALESGGPEPRFYPFRCFEQLRVFLAKIADFANSEFNTVRKTLQEALDPEVLHFLQELRVEDVWGRFRRESRSDEQFLRRFHTWFDYLATIRFLNRLCGPRRLAFDQAWPEYAPALGLYGIPSAELALETLRQQTRQGNASVVNTIL